MANQQFHHHYIPSPAQPSAPEQQPSTQNAAVDVNATDSEGRNLIMKKALEGVNPFRIMWIYKKMYLQDPNSEKSIDELLLQHVLECQAEGIDPFPATLVAHHKEDKKAGKPICSTCERAFDPLKNSEKSCHWHEGDVVGNEDANVWEHHPDLEYSFEHFVKDPNYSVGFVWDCCGQSYASVKAGCQRGRHVPPSEPVRPVIKKRRMEETLGERPGASKRVK